VLNLDAHFDLRNDELPSSGTPFLQMAQAEEAAGRGLSYAVLGIAESSNTEVLFNEARRIGARWLTDFECAEVGIKGVRDFVEDFVKNLDTLYLSVDLDLLPASVAPGVSAPATLGVATPLVLAAVRAAAETGKLRIMDVVELAPKLDCDNRTAKIAARIIDEAVGAAF
jgi:formiminoglutamase